MTVKNYERSFNILLAKAGMNRADVARALSVSRATVTMDIQNPTDRKIERLIKAIPGATIEELEKEADNG